jgi:hypothetical protein
MGSPAAGFFWLQFGPVLVAWVVLAVLAVRIGKRKGVRPAKCIAGTFPLWAAIFLVWLASKTDTSVLQRLEQLETNR